MICSNILIWPKTINAWGHTEGRLSLNCPPYQINPLLALPVAAVKYLFHVMYSWRCTAFLSQPVAILNQARERQRQQLVGRRGPVTHSVSFLSHDVFRSRRVVMDINGVFVILPDARTQRKATQRHALDQVVLLHIVTCGKVPSHWFLNM